MKYFLLSFAMLLAACNSSHEELTLIPPVDADFSRIYAYTPAPGQFINSHSEDAEINAGFNGEQSPEAACSYAERRLRTNQYVSLGGWGGYLIAGFKEPILNDGGDNIQITGNQMSSSSEPGIVYVMPDTNGNGLPDDTWYELKGSQWEQTTHNYTIGYTRPHDGQNTPWQELNNPANSGTIDRNAHHTQAQYYPAWIKTDQYTLTGSKLKSNLVVEEGLQVAKPYAWGYVDNFSTTRRDLFRISDAVNAVGEPAHLSAIDFVKIQTAVQAQAPEIGEISTEVCSIRNYNLIKEK